MQVTRIIPYVPSFLASSLTIETWSILFMVVQALQNKLEKLNVVHKLLWQHQVECKT